MVWRIKHFAQLTNQELYAILKMRADVFVVEQNCVYPDLDNKDQDAIHVLGYKDKEFIAYARIIPEKDQCHIGRIIVLPKTRGNGLGKLMIKRCEEYSKHALHHKLIKLSAQQYLKKFYTDLGYKTISEPYDWDGISHIDMEKKISSA